MTHKWLAVLVVIGMVLGLVPSSTEALSWVDGDVVSLWALEPGDIVVDTSVNWEFREGENYTGTGTEKPLRWIVVKQDHFASDTTLLLTEELVGRYHFDESSAIWADSDLRAWLQGDGVDDFYGNLSTLFQSAIVEVPTMTSGVQNSDTVFALSATEVGWVGPPDLAGDGSSVGFFFYNTDRVATFDGTTKQYWLRTTDDYYPGEPWGVSSMGYLVTTDWLTHTGFYVRPAVNLRADTQVVYDSGVWVLAEGPTGPGYTSPGVAGVFIDPIDDITLNPVELEEMQTDGLVIPVGGFVQYISDFTEGNPALAELLVMGQVYDEMANGGLGDWVEDDALIGWSSTALKSTDIRDSKQGREFTDDAFNISTWEIHDTGEYRVYAHAVFTPAGEPDAVEEFTVELVSPTITVYPMAAPNIAEIILEAEEVDPNQSTGNGKNKAPLNLITEVAHHMGPQTLFDGTEKSIMEGQVEVCNAAYWDAVLGYLNGFGFAFTYRLEDYIDMCLTGN
ncbi:MAG: DUF6273 domain-containing protein [Bacillota bacterium]